MNRLLKYPLKIGLTGGIGSGKTTVANILKTLGIPIFNSDENGKKLFINNKNVINETIKHFGNNILTNKNIDLKKLGNIVFSNKKELAVLNNIIHPNISRIFNEWYNKQTTKYIIKESAILFESNTYKKVDKIILIKAPINLRIQRTCMRDKRSVSEVKKIIQNQLPVKKIIKHANYIVNNNEKKLLVPQVMDIHNMILNL